MAATTIANLQIVPSKFAEYILERTTEKSALVRSGIAVSDPTVSQIINGSQEGRIHHYHAVLQAADR